MCMYCESIKQGKPVIVDVRSTMAVDNICEKVNGKSCGGCECNTYFEIDSFKLTDSEYYMTLNFRQTVEDLVVAPFSIGLPVIYCQFCGTKISDIKDFNVDVDMHGVDFDDDIILQDQGLLDVVSKPEGVVEKYEYIQRNNQLDFDGDIIDYGTLDVNNDYEV